MTERMVKSNGIELWTESFGEHHREDRILVFGGAPHAHRLAPADAE